MEKNERYEVNNEGKLVVGIPETLSSRDDIIKELFERNGWEYELLEKYSNGHFLIKLTNKALDNEFIIHLYHGNVRKEDPDRNREEKKIQLGGQDPRVTKNEKTIILGFYVTESNPKIEDVIIVAWPVEDNKNYPDNPSLRVNMRKDVLPAKNKGFHYDAQSGKRLVAFRPEFIYYYLENYERLHMYQLPESQEKEEKTLEEKIIETYNQMDLLEMEQEIEVLYNEFRERYSPEVLSNIDDKDLPRYMFYSERNNKNNLCWTLEFHPKNKEYFGSISGGSAYLYGLHYSQKHNKWMTGTSHNQIELDETGAIEKAKEIRNVLIDTVDIVKQYKQPLTIADYGEMHQKLLELDEDLVDKLWVRKYLHMIFPSVFSTFYSWKWLAFLGRKCKFEQHSDLYEMSGELSILSNRVDLPNAVLSKVLFEMFGYPIEEEKISNIIEEESNNMTVRNPRTNKTHPLNRIVYGAPGTGKTYSMKEYAVATIEGREVRKEQLTIDQRKELNEKYKELVSCGQVVFTTFHQSYGYEDFIQGLRPDTSNGAMEFVPMDGVFKKIADKAMQDTENNYVIVIDEINRGNISKVFGELITLIEDDKRWGESEQLSVILPSGEEFAVPNNLYIIGTMNSADKSIALIDTALRRRFDFIEVSPNAELVEDDTLRKVLEQLNAVLRKELDSSDLLIGHAYFIGKSSEELVGIMNRNIIPLLYEYFYDNEKKVKDALVKALDGTEVKPKDNNQGRIRVE